jgi:cyclopropane fatty-acyl-phospholipid synthase-like methyltransferase
VRNWQRFFQAEAPRYLEYGFTKNTAAEVDFIEGELGLLSGQSILDIGCGTGRHSLELTRRGYSCTGIDLSADMLAQARRLAEAEGLEVELVQGDASDTRLDRTFDNAICLCEGAFSLMEPGTEPVAYHSGILANIHAMLRPGGMFLLTAINGMRLIRHYSDDDVAAGLFDPLTISEIEQMPAGNGATVTVIEKGFLPSELTGLLEAAGFHVLSLWGGTAGGWNKAPLKLDEIELMVVAQKPGSAAAWGLAGMRGVRAL